MNTLFECGELMPCGAPCTGVAMLQEGERDYTELILLEQGGAARNTAFYGGQVSLPAVIYIPPGVNDRFVPDERVHGYRVRFKTGFLPHHSAGLFAAFFDACNLPLTSFALQEAVSQLFKMICYECVSNNANERTIQYLLLALLAKIDFVRKATGNRGDCKEKDYLTCKAFMMLLEDNFSHNHKVDFYSKQLNVSLRSLNYITTRVMGKSVLQLIDMRKQAEAQELLANSSKSITEIAYELGFDKSYFSRFFYKKAGVTPMQFRQNRQNAVS
ncbi:AraC-like DNA-binding protein [Filimonas zeae]|uniref:HTH araC/xylS-type domain-containing protein n=1 Tax=Filimonas zeae TaxID=1737353 RepID=A0A917J2E0_9BACT|nr:helix-turn-helix domain-containing protein [Filimonas zeae]MDR6342012.1 AraC-like DNA-binding protein [Filimonas zeae]GGH79460.1 hypothetical protein GCM10011379_48860 [Filimonas zeae]